jgi:cytochrome c-type biogenesis protein CcmH/NrfF
MMHRRTLLRALCSLPASALLAAPLDALAQQLGEGMERSGTLDIRNDEERAVFGDLQCTCGCPREAISTCTCAYAANFRSEVRGMLARGMTREEIKAEWVKRNGPQALTVPSNTGANRLVYAAPLVAIVAGGAVAVKVLRGFRRKADVKAAAAEGPVAGAGRDEYDDKLDEELKQLDDE